MTVLLAMVALARLRAQDSPLEVLERQGNEAFGKRDCASALKNYEAAGRLATGESLADRAGLIYRRIGICKGRQGDIEGSLTAYRSGVTVSENARDREILTENVHGLGLALQRLGRLDEALAPAEREYSLAQQCRHPAHLVRAMWLVAALYDRTGKRRVAMQMFEQALQISRNDNDRAAMVIRWTILRSVMRTLAIRQPESCWKKKRSPCPIRLTRRLWGTPG
jgi:tetratricopeptide (TPR) repeat protein